MNQSQPHRATHEQWQKIAEFVKDCGYDSCLLELRARVEALEAAANSSASLTSSNHPAAPDSSLVDRIRGIIGLDPVGDGKARSAIREVAAWLDGQIEVGAAHLLRQEANQ